MKQTAWSVLSKNTVGIWPPVTQVGGTDVINPVNEVCNPQSNSSLYGLTTTIVYQIANVATNDAAQLSVNEYAVLAIAPELAPNSLVEEREDWDHEIRTLKGSVSDSSITKEAVSAGSKELRNKEKRSGWKAFRKMLCFY